MNADVIIGNTNQKNYSFIRVHKDKFETHHKGNDDWSCSIDDNWKFKSKIWGENKPNLES